MLAARHEAMLRAEPEIGSLWRLELALAEAVASVGFEGIRIAEGDLRPRILLNGRQNIDPNGAELALGWKPSVDPDDEPHEHLLEDAELFEVEIERFALSRD